MRHRTFYDRQTRRVRDTDAAGWRLYLAFEQRRVACSCCQGVKVERLDWLAQNPRYTQRFAHHVGTLCRDMSNKAVAQLLHLHEHTVKDLDPQYLRAWLAKTPPPAPQVIGVDELSIKKGHTYRIVASDLERGRLIWVGGQGRTEADLDRFVLDLGPQKTTPHPLGRDGHVEGVPQLGPDPRAAGADSVRHVPHPASSGRRHGSGPPSRVQTRRREGPGLHQGPALHAALPLGPSHAGRPPLAPEAPAGQQATGYRLLAHGRVRSTLVVSREGWARQFFTRWREQLKWQRLRPFEKFTTLIEKHWNGIVAYCDPRNKVKLGFVEGLTNKIRITRSA
ncbi:MAG: ISL3 family transposase [Nitrospira defluvii]|nr:ISL3 family transposase [Nitrospira defluvii]